MDEKQNAKQTATFEEVLMATVYQQEAMMNLLERKGFISRQEVMAEIIEMKNRIGGKNPV